MVRTSQTCYLCGLPGADSRDHVPSQNLVPSGGGAFERISVAAHRSCNGRDAQDEDYVRDLLAPDAAQPGASDAEAPYQKLWRAWNRSGGWSRYQQFLANAGRQEVNTPYGLGTVCALTVEPDMARLAIVGSKIVRGVLFHDTGNFRAEGDLDVVTLPTPALQEARARDADAPYWRALASASAIHTHCARGVILRRIYLANQDEGGASTTAHVVVALWGCCFVASVSMAGERPAIQTRPPL
jgi:hypothetical protein